MSFSSHFQARAAEKVELRSGRLLVAAELRIQDRCSFQEAYRDSCLPVAEVDSPMTQAMPVKTERLRSSLLRRVQIFSARKADFREPAKAVAGEAEAVVSLLLQVPAEMEQWLEIQVATVEVQLLILAQVLVEELEAQGPPIRVVLALPDRLAGSSYPLPFHESKLRKEE